MFICKMPKGLHGLSKQMPVFSLAGQSEVFKEAPAAKQVNGQFEMIWQQFLTHSMYRPNRMYPSYKV